MSNPDTDIPPAPAQAGPAPAPGSVDATFLDAAERIRALEAERDDFPRPLDARRGGDGEPAHTHQTRGG